MTFLILTPNPTVSLDVPADASAVAQLPLLLTGGSFTTGGSQGLTQTVEGTLILTANS